MDESKLLREGLNLWIRILSDMKLADILEWTIFKSFRYISRATGKFAQGQFAHGQFAQENEK